MKMENKNIKNVSRRLFLKTSTASLLSFSIPLLNSKLFICQNDAIKVALIGCGQRGKEALGNFAQACKILKSNYEIVALADYFKQPAIDTAIKFGIPQECCHVGPKAYKEVMASNADVVLLVTPPIFRPVHFQAAIQAGKHVFMEKPAAVDPAGVHKVLETAEFAKQKALSVVAGTQRRHEKKYIETQYAISKGAIGEIKSGKVWWCDNQFWYKERKPDENDASYLIRNWLNFTEMSGDHIVEQHIHQIDVANWFIGKQPKIAIGVGGRARRKTGNQYDFFSVDFDYGDGLSVHSTCRQINGCYTKIEEFFTGDTGISWATGPGIKGFPNRVNIPDFKIQCENPYVQEHIDLIKSIKDTKPINEAANLANSTLTSIMGRISAYTGYPVRWKELTEKRYGSPWYDLKLTPSPEDFETGNVNAPLENIIPIPGKE